VQRIFESYDFRVNLKATGEKTSWMQLKPNVAGKVPETDAKVS